MSKNLWISQNFLTSARLIQKLIQRTSLQDKDTVIEIGTGKGHITKELLRCCKTVISYELDEKYYMRGKEKFAANPNIILKHQDFLQASLPKNGDYKIFANIPFHITTKIMNKITEAKNPPAEVWLVMEKGAAQRFCGKHKESMHSLYIKPIYDLQIAFYFRREDFHPMPSVDCVLLHLKRKAQFDVPLHQMPLYRDTIKRIFPHKGGAILYIEWLCLFRRYASTKHFSPKLR